MSNWTQEPWILDWDGDNLDCIHNEKSVIAMAIGGDDPDDSFIKISKADAERIVACVNAFAGVEDPAAEIAALKAMLLDYKEVHEDKQRLVRELDFAIYGSDAAPQASLCDLVACIPKEIATLRTANQVLMDALEGLYRCATMPPSERPLQDETDFLDVVEAACEALAKARKESTND